MAKIIGLLSKLTGSVWFSLAAPALLFARYGAGLAESWSTHAFAVIWLLHLAAILLPDGRTLWSRLKDDHWVTLFLALTIAVLTVVAASGADWPEKLRVIRIVIQASVVIIAARLLIQHMGSFLINHVRVWAILPISLAAIILTGTGLLLLPAATNGIDPLDALFTATSAVCVTGLTVVDTATVFTPFGQAVILSLIQVGGLGLMSFFAFFALFMGHGVGLGQSLSITRAVNASFTSDVRRTIGSIIGWTFTVEATGAIILFTAWRPVLTGLNTTGLVWQSVFHSVSAFCNAGFSLFPDNLESFREMPSICLTISCLIVAGGIGFAVLTALVTAFMSTLRGKRRNRLDVHARLVALVTAALILGGTVFVLAVEWDGALRGMSLPVKISNALLSSITPRTAGFDTIPALAFHPATRWVFVALMFIGASPGGTGGGVKTTTVGLLAAAGFSLLRKKPGPELWHRMVPLHDLQRAAGLFFACLVFCTVSSTALLLSETVQGEDGTCADEYIFESVSAFATVGLSTGVTRDLTVPGHWIIIVTMFAGRVGPSVLAALTVRPRTTAYSLPEGRIEIG